GRGYERLNVSDWESEPPVDLRQITFEGFVTFLFDRIPKDPDDPWFYGVEFDCVLFEKSVFVQYYARLFSDSAGLLARFSPHQLELHFWAIQSNAAFGLGDLIWDPDVPLAQRVQCVESMYSLFEKLFVQDSLETSVFMWWDSMCYGRKGGIADSDEILDAMLGTLVRILRLPDEACQMAALHGFNHLEHSQAAVVVAEFLARTDLESHVREYAEDVMHGKAQ
ncbi:MAG: hypothetical protein AB7I09_08405, partial [Planctomycetota bacterium]